MEQSQKEEEEENLCVTHLDDEEKVTQSKTPYFFFSLFFPKALAIQLASINENDISLSCPLYDDDDD